MDRRLHPLSSKSMDDVRKSSDEVPSESYEYPTKLIPPMPPVNNSTPSKNSVDDPRNPLKSTQNDLPLNSAFPHLFATQTSFIRSIYCRTQRVIIARSWNIAPEAIYTLSSSPPENLKSSKQIVISNNSWPASIIFTNKVSPIETSNPKTSSLHRMAVSRSRTSGMVNVSVWPGRRKHI